MELSIEEIIADLGNTQQPLRNSKLVELSNLSPAQLELFVKEWSSIEQKRRWQIIHRLVELTEENFELNFDSIFRYCLKDQDAEVRSKAIEGLWQSEDISLISLFINLLEQDNSVSAQAAAAMALGKFAMLAELGKLRSCHTTRICQVLLAVIDDKKRSVEVRRRALEAVAPLSLPQVEATIRKGYQGQNHRLKVSAIYAMGKSCSRSWLPVLLRELFSVEAEIRYEAAGACGELGEEEATPYLMKLIDDPDLDVRLAAIQALGKIGGSEAKECLRRCLYNPDEVIRRVAEEALYELEVEENPFTFRV
jgi:HEAT repeat protein